jgi:hypothetical protein
MIPSTFDRAKEYIEAMEFRSAEGITKAEWDRDGYMAILSRLHAVSDFVAALLQIPRCAGLPFILESCLLACHEVKPLIPRPALALLEDLIVNPHLMDRKPRRERLWQRAGLMLKLGFREDQNLPRLPESARAAGTAVYEAALIYTTPFIPLHEAHKALEICLKAAVAAQEETEGGNTVLPKLLPLAQREYDIYRQVAAELGRPLVRKEVKL